MKDEIKEILDYLKDKNDYIEDFGISYKRIHIDNGDLKTLLDYITNLQQIEQEHKKINGELRERISYLERSNDRREDTILGLRQEINDVEDSNNELKKKLDKTLEVLQYELQFQTGGCYHRLSNLFDYLQNGSENK